jgi:hypothetical protein
MTFQPKDLSGHLFKNTRKTLDSHADYQGNALIGGREFYLDAWLRDGAKGKYMAIRFKPRDEEQWREIGA